MIFRLKGKEVDDSGKYRREISLSQEECVLEMRESILKAPKKSKETMKIDSDDDVFQRFFVDHHHHGVLSIDRLPTDFHTLYHLYF